jgi:hypothetical protein
LWSSRIISKDEKNIEKYKGGCQQCFKGVQASARYTWTPRRQGATIFQDKLGTPGRLGDAFKILDVSCCCCRLRLKLSQGTVRMDKSI